MTHFVMEADGASRGNPGHASYGTVIRNANTGEVVAERAAVLGHATNNVAEYNGLVAGLRGSDVRGGGNDHPGSGSAQGVVQDGEHRGLARASNA